MSRLLPLLLAALGAGLACGPPTDPAGDPLFADPHALEVLTEEAELGEPTSDRPNRLFRGWRPRRTPGRRALLASPGGASLQVVTVLPGERTVSLDLLDVGGLGRAGHLEIRIDGGPPGLVPVADPLSIRLPESLEPGRHLVELSPRGAWEPTLLVAGSAIRPAHPAGGARLERRDLVQAGPSLVDVAARPGPGRTLAGELCPAGFLAGTGGVHVELVSEENRPIAGWSGGGGLGDRRLTRRLTRPWGCRRIELAAGDEAGPLRVRLTVRAEGAEVRWRGWSWLPAEGPERPPRGSAPEPPVEGPSPPRLVVLYVMDALRADHLGHLGGPAGISPVVDRLAREGVTFRRHWSTGPNTLAAISDLFTGEVWTAQRAWRAAGPSRTTLAEVFRDAGYRTGLVSGNVYLTGEFGLARGFEHVAEEALFEMSPARSPEVNRSAEGVHAAALAWLDSLPGDEPVFLHLQTIHPHNPYAPPPDLERRFTAGIPSGIGGDTRTLIAIQRGRLDTTAADRERLRALYAASVAYNDRELGRFLEALGERFPPEETLIVVTSDHGEELFDHGGVLHGYTLYEELLHVPLVVRWPGTVRPRGRSGGWDRPTDALDLHATLLDAAGALGRVPSGGRSLLPLLTGRVEELPERLLFAAAPGVGGGIHAVRDGPWKLIRVRGTPERWVMGTGRGRSWEREYLFDLASDPGEERNLAGTGGVREAWLRARLRCWLAERRAAASSEEPAPQAPLDAETERRLRALGYVD